MSRVPLIGPIDFHYARGEVAPYAFRPKLMPSLRQELALGVKKAYPDAVEVSSLYVEGDKVLRRLEWNVRPAWPPLFVLSEPVELVPREVVDCVLEVMDPASDSGNEWMQAKVGLASEVMAAVDALARRLARLSGYKVVRP